MSTSSIQVSDLLLEWEEAREQGRSLSPEHLCRDHPALLPELKKRIAALEKLNPWLRIGRTLHTIAFGPEPDLTGEIRQLLHTRLRIAGSILLAATLVLIIFSVLDPVDRNLDWLDYLPMCLVLSVT